MPGLAEFDMYVAAMPSEDLRIVYRALYLHCYAQRIAGIKALRESLPQPSEADTSLIFLQQAIGEPPAPVDLTPAQSALRDRVCEDCEA